MVHWFTIAAAGAVGAVARYAVSSSVSRLMGPDFPYGTLAVNVLGSFVIGLLSALLLERVVLDDAWRLSLTVGFLGSFTTFSTFSLETLTLLESGDYLKAAAYASLSLLLSLMAVALGLMLGRL